MKYIALAIGLSSCAELYYGDLECWKTDTCGKESPVTSGIVKMEYLADQNGFNTEIYLTDEKTGTKYQLIRNNRNEKLELRNINLETILDRSER